MQNFSEVATAFCYVPCHITVVQVKYFWDNELGEKIEIWTSADGGLLRGGSLIVSQDGTRASCQPESRDYLIGQFFLLVSKPVKLRPSVSILFQVSIIYHSHQSKCIESLKKAKNRRNLVESNRGWFYLFGTVTQSCSSKNSKFCVSYQLKKGSFLHPIIGMYTIEIRIPFWFDVGPGVIMLTGQLIKPRGMGNSNGPYFGL